MATVFSSCASKGVAVTPVRRSGRNQPETITFDNFVSEIYLPHIQYRKRSWKVDERIALQYLSQSFGNRLFTDIHRSDVEAWFRDLSRRGLAPSSCNRILAVFKSICTLAAAFNVLPEGRKPCTGMAALKVSNQRDRYLSKDEARRLVQELEQSMRPEAIVIHLLLLTGARKNEILKARWEDVHLDQHMLTVPLSKSGKPRHIPYPIKLWRLSVPSRVFRSVPGFFPAMRRASRSPTSGLSGTVCGAGLGLRTCASMTCDIRSQVFW